MAESWFSFGSGVRRFGIRAAGGVAVILSGVAAAGMLGAADAPTGGERGVRAYVLSNIYFGNALEEGVCRQLADGGLESFYNSLSPEEQAKYATPEKRPALEQLMNRRLGFRRIGIHGGDPGGRIGQAKLPPSLAPGATPTPEQAIEIGALNGFPKGKGRLAFQKQTVAYSACTDPQDFPQLAKGFRPYDGKVAYGMNLDGKTGKAGYTSPTGEKGVDNQLWHAIGCVWAFRESGEDRVARNVFFSARAPTLIEIRGLDDPHNDPDVTVHIYAGADPLVKDGQGKALARATFDLDPDPRLRAVTRGRIENGVLTTDPVDIRLNYKEQIVDAPRDIRGARIRATLKNDGTIEGGFYGYYTLDSFYSSIEQMTQNGANLSRVSCPGVRQAIDRFADGYRDPRTGRFTAISSALSFQGVQAFVAPGQGDAPVGLAAN